MFFSKLTFFLPFFLFLPPVEYSVVLDPIDFHCLETWNFSIVFIYLCIYWMNKVDLFGVYTHTCKKKMYLIYNKKYKY